MRLSTTSLSQGVHFDIRPAGNFQAGIQFFSVGSGWKTAEMTARAVDTPLR